MNLFDAKNIGVHISDDSIRILELNSINGGASVGLSEEVKIEKGIIVCGKIVKKDKLKEIVNNLFLQNFKEKNKKIEIVLSVNESNIFSHGFLLEKSEISREKVLEKLDKFFPKNIDNYLVEYRIIEDIETENNHDEKNIFVFALAVEREFLKSWQSFFLKLGFRVKYFKPESIARKNIIEDSHDILLIDIKKDFCYISIFLKHQIFYTYKYDYENLFDRDLDRVDLSITNEKTAVLKSIFSEIVIEMEKSIAYLKKNTGRDINLIYLTGEMSDIKGLKNYLMKELDSLEKKPEIKDIKSINKVDKDFYISYGLVKDSVNKKEITFSLEKSNYFSLFQVLPGVKYFKKIFLIFATFLFIVIVSTLYFKKEIVVPDVLKEDFTAYQEVDSYFYDIFLVEGQSARGNEISGRFFEISFEKPIPINELLINAKNVLENELNENEFFWERPFEDIVDKDVLTFPLKTIWFIGQKKDLRSILEEKIYKKIEIKEGYEVKPLLNNLVEKTSHKGILKTRLEVLIYHNSDLASYQLEESFEKMVLIVNTNTNNINIRKGPGTNFPVVAQAIEGEVYQFLDEQGSWTNIKIVDGNSAWISSLFVRKLD